MELSRFTGPQCPLFTIMSFFLLVTSSARASPVAAQTSPDEAESTSKHSNECQKVDTSSKCFKFLQYAQLPNVYGHQSQERVTQELEEVLRKFSNPGQELLSFLCTLYFPPCHAYPSLTTAASANYLTPLPCRVLCESAWAAMFGEGQGQGQDTSAWPVMCHSLPAERCYSINDQGSIVYVQKSLKAIPKASSSSTKSEEVVKFASIESEMGADEGYELEVVSISSSQNPIRRYDITDFGDPELFQGWADVQGSGAANDYCRVIGRAKRRFLSCNLAGSWGQGHHYVSKLGFDMGYPGTWFMRDMDGDGKDDYCRCVGSTSSNSKVTCMKAGEHGFYGGTTQRGSQHTFTLPLSEGCRDKKVNAMFGE